MRVRRVAEFFGQFSLIEIVGAEGAEKKNDDDGDEGSLFFFSHGVSTITKGPPWKKGLFSESYGLLLFLIEGHAALCAFHGFVAAFPGADLHLFFLELLVGLEKVADLLEHVRFDVGD